WRPAVAFPPIEPLSSLLTTTFRFPAVETLPAFRLIVALPLIFPAALLSIKRFRFSPAPVGPGPAAEMLFAVTVIEALPPIIPPGGTADRSPNVIGDTNSKIPSAGNARGGDANRGVRPNETAGRTVTKSIVLNEELESAGLNTDIRIIGVGCQCAVYIDCD